MSRSDGADLHPVVLEGGNAVRAKFMFSFLFFPDSFLKTTFHPADVTSWWLLVTSLVITGRAKRLLGVLV